MNQLHKTTWIVLVLLLPGCFWAADPNLVRHDGPDLADVIDGLPELALPEATAGKPSRAEVLAAYEKVYGSMPEVSTNQAIGKRLADLRMSVGEDNDIAGQSNPYQGAVTLYQSLLAQTGDMAPGSDEILYQLARAHDVSGDTEQTVVHLDKLINLHPQSTYAPEAHFRRAEIAFSNKRYRAAAADYGVVVAEDEPNPYWRNASYMRGWAQFKESDLDASLSSFFAVIDNIVPEDGTAELPRTDAELLSDSFRVVTLALDYLDGAKTLSEQMTELNKPHWQYLVYQELADSQLRKERYLDSVGTWQTFIEQNDLDPRAPQAHEGMIKTLIEADFPSEVRPKKEEYIARYGVRSEFWGAHEESVRASYIDTLKSYLNEIATVAHSEAQQTKGSKRQNAFVRAARWYEEIIETIPDNPAVAEHLFLLGEAYTEAEEDTKAVEAYQRVVRDHPSFVRANEAGYAAILGLNRLVASAPQDENEIWQRLKIDAQIEFSLLFADDSRAPSVQTAAADSLFELDQFKQAVDIAENALMTWPTMATDIKSTNLSIVGHGWFELGNFVAAENAYSQLLSLSETAPQDDIDKSAIRERLLAAIYKQGEGAEQAGHSDDAANHYLRLAQVDPKAELAAQGHFDAVAVMENAGRFSEAAELLDDFRNRYPNSEFNKDIASRLAGLYAKTDNWSMAAEEFVNLSNTAADPQVRQQSLYRAGELYLELQDNETAMRLFSDYANRYSSPKDTQLEAIEQVDQILIATAQDSQRRPWLRRKIDVHKSMGAQATERATFLAASAQAIFAAEEKQRFVGLKLTNPLPASLKRKQAALAATVKAYEQLAEYKVSEYITASTFEIANVYAQLSKSIMASERPGGLSALELEQYDILLEEQAYPFEEQAITLHEINMRRSWSGTYDEWVKASFVALGELMPARFNKQEVQVAYVESIH